MNEMKTMDFYLDCNPLIFKYIKLMRKVCPSSFLFSIDQIKFQLEYAIQGDHGSVDVVDFFSSYGFTDDMNALVNVSENMATYIHFFIYENTKFFPYHFQYCWRLLPQNRTLELTYAVRH